MMDYSHGMLIERNLDCDPLAAIILGRRKKGLQHSIPCCRQSLGIFTGQLSCIVSIVCILNRNCNEGTVTTLALLCPNMSKFIKRF